MELIVVINATHVLVIQEDILGGLHRNAGTIFLITCSSIAIGSCQCHHSVVLPCCHDEDTYLPGMSYSHPSFSPLGLSVSRKPFLLECIVPHLYSLSASRLSRRSRPMKNLSKQTWWEELMYGSVKVFTILAPNPCSTLSPCFLEYTWKLVMYPLWMHQQVPIPLCPFYAPFTSFRGIYCWVDLPLKGIIAWSTLTFFPGLYTAWNCCGSLLWSKLLL